MSSLIALNFVAVGLQHLPSPAPKLDVAMVLGFFSSFFTIVCYFHRHLRPFAFGLSLGLAAMSFYAFLQNAWPLGIAEGIWCATSLRHLFPRSFARPLRLIKPPRNGEQRWEQESRLSRMFGRN